MSIARIVVQDHMDDPLKMVEVDLPEPRGHQVQIRITASGVCHTQLYWMHQDHPDPMLFGHEGIGVVEQVGDSVSGVHPGQSVLVTWVPRHEEGRAPQVATVLLPDGRRATSPNVYTWADRAVLDESYLVPLTGTAHDLDICIAGCAIMTGAGAVSNALSLTEKDTLAVFGAGGIGLSAIAGARAAKVRTIIAVDVTDEKLEFAKSFGATHTINGNTENAVARIHEIVAGERGDSGVEYALDCVGISSTTQQALDSVRAGLVGSHPGGTVALVGIPTAPLTIDGHALVFGQKHLTGALAGGCTQADIHTFIKWNTDGTFSLSDLVTDRFSFEEISTAAESLEAGQVLGRAIITM